MIFKMAWRNIWRNKMRSMVIMISIAIGLFAGIAILAIYKGMMKGRIRTTIDTEVGHLQLHDMDFKKDYDPKYVIQQGAGVLKKIQAFPDITLAAPRTILSGMLATTTSSAGVMIIGVIPHQEYLASALDKKLIVGNLFSNRKNEVLLGKKLATKMKLGIGSKLVLTFSDTTGNIISGAFRVAGIYESMNMRLDEKQAYIKMVDINELLMLDGTFHEVTVRLQNDESLMAVQEQLKKKFPNLLVENWKQISPETELMVNTTNQLSYIIMVIIMLALAFGIINTMLMAILERTREIGMMVALGTSKQIIFWLVLTETCLLTLGGIPFGLLTAWLASVYYTKKGLDLSGMGKEMMSSFGYNTVIYPEFPVDKLLGVMLIIICTALASCIFPSVKALKLKPVEALRR